MQKTPVWTLVTVSIALFVACLLAVKLSLVPTAMRGATIGLSIWAAYFSILVWISSTTVGSLVGSVVNTATRGFQAVFGTATAALGIKAAGSELVSSEAVRREMTAYLDPQDVRASFQDLVGKVKSPDLDLKGIRSEFEKILKDSELNKIVDKDNLPTLSRDTFENLLKERTDLSPRDVKKIVDELDRSGRIYPIKNRPIDCETRSSPPAGISRSECSRSHRNACQNAEGDRSLLAIDS